MSVFCQNWRSSTAAVTRSRSELSTTVHSTSFGPLRRTEESDGREFGADYAMVWTVENGKAVAL
jgi:ketosteroid isomerase-like protein